MSLSIFDAAAEAPGTAALIQADAVVTYERLAADAALAVNWLRRQGVGARSTAPVALVADASPSVIHMLHALIAMAVPVHLLHPRLTEAEREALIARIHPLLVIEADWDADIEAPDSVEAPDIALDADDDERTLAVVYTSGTAGAPKGVLLTRRAFAASATASAANLGWRDDDRWLLRLPLAHVGGLSILTRCLHARRAMALPPDPGPDEDVTRALAQIIQRQRITLLSLVPTLLLRMLEMEPAWDPPTQLRAILLGGAAADSGLLKQAADRGWPVLTTYGMTETCSQATTQPYGTTNRGEAGSGRTIEGMDLRVVDGEIQVRGPALFSGYFPAGALPDPFLPDGWFATGDLGRLDGDGNLHVTGRRGDRIITGGENVDPLEVEHALRACDGVADACVFGLPDTEWGSRVCATIVAEEGRHLDPGTLDSALRERLASFKCPHDYAIVDDLPLNATGKLDRNAAAARFANRLVTLRQAPGGQT